MLLQANQCSDEMVNKIVAMMGGKLTESQIREGLNLILQKREAEFAEKRARRAEAKEYERKVNAPLFDLFAKDPRSAQLRLEFQTERSRIQKRKPQPMPPLPPDIMRPTDWLVFPPFDAQMSNKSNSGMLTTTDPSQGFMEIGDNVTEDRVDTGYVYLGHSFQNDQDRNLTFNCTFQVNVSLDLLSMWGSTAHASGVLRLEVWQLIYTAPWISVLARQDTQLFSDSTGWNEHHHNEWGQTISVLPKTFFAPAGFRYICWAGCETTQDGGVNADSTADTKISLNAAIL